MLLTSAMSKTAIVSKYTSNRSRLVFFFSFSERPNADVPSLPPCRAGMHRWWLFVNFFVVCTKKKGGGAGMLTKRCCVPDRPTSEGAQFRLLAAR
jgi:hypothetical protein